MKLRKVRPGFSVYDLSDRGAGHPEAADKGRDGGAAGSAATNLDHVGACKNGGPVQFSAPLCSVGFTPGQALRMPPAAVPVAENANMTIAPLRDHVGDIVGPRAEEQVCRVNAWRVVAAVEDTGSAWVTCGDGEEKPVYATNASLPFYRSVPVASAGPNPHPALTTRLHADLAPYPGWQPAVLEIHQATIACMGGGR